MGSEEAGSGEFQLTASLPAETGRSDREESAGAIERPRSRQLSKAPATVAAVTTKATAKPMASRASETTTLFFMGVSVHRGVGDRSGRHHESDPQAHRQQKERNNILVFHGAACLCFCIQGLLYTSPQPILDQTADFVTDYGVFLEPVAVRGVR